MDAFGVFAHEQVVVELIIRRARTETLQMRLATSDQVSGDDGQRGEYDMFLGLNMALLPQTAQILLRPANVRQVRWLYVFT